MRPITNAERYQKYLNRVDYIVLLFCTLVYNVTAGPASEICQGEISEGHLNNRFDREGSKNTH